MRPKPLLADRLVAEARSWLGTKFLHQGKIKGSGVDCVNFIAEAARDAGIQDINIPHNYQPSEDGKVMLALLRDHMEFIPQDELKPGDVLALIDESLRMPDVPRHLVIVTDITPVTMYVIHASEHGVREHRLDGHWVSRIHSCWRIKQ